MTPVIFEAEIDGMGIRKGDSMVTIKLIVDRGQIHIDTYKMLGEWHLTQKRLKVLVTTEGQVKELAEAENEEQKEEPERERLSAGIPYQIQKSAHYRAWVNNLLPIPMHDSDDPHEAFKRMLGIEHTWELTEAEVSSFIGLFNAFINRNG